MINFFAHFAGDLGYPIFARNIMLAMEELRPGSMCPVPYDPNMVGEFFDERQIKLFARRPSSKTTSVCVSYGNDMSKFSGARRIGHTVWETTRLPDGWVEGLNELDEVWTMSEWGAGVMRDSGVEVPIKKVTSGVGPLFTPFAPPLEEFAMKGEDRPFIFLSVFKWEKRKGPDILIKAFHSAFEEDEKVVLLLLCYNPFLGVPETQWNLYKYYFMYYLGIKDERVQFLPPIEDHDVLPRLYTSSDAFVLPSRGEGFGLPYLEAMACGVPTIGTRFSANVEFMNDDNSWLIDVENMVEAEQEPFIKKKEGSLWAEPSMDSLIGHMRYVYDKREAAKKKAMAASEKIRAEYNWKERARIAWKCIDEGGC